MKAIVKVDLGAGHTELRDVAEPTPKPGEVIVQVGLAGICGSDIHVAQGEFQDWLRPPVIIGHEFAGTIAALGDDVTGLQVGQQVTSETTYQTCGHCRYCKTDNPNLCPERQVLGYQVNGVFTRYVAVPAERIYPLPDGVDVAAASMTEPVACGVHAVSEVAGGLLAGDWTVVLGPGTIGQVTAQVAKAEGAQVLLIGAPGDEERLEIARSLGIDATALATQPDLVAWVREQTGGYGADAVFECSGSPQAARMGLELVRRQGKLIQVGIFGHPFELDVNMVVQKELTLAGSISQRPSAWRRALSLMATGKVQTKPLITDTYPITDWDEALAKATNRIGLKIALEPVS